ncbi:hypothetical protein DSECCO2_203370 [anaerobic digester metagenome]
MFSKKLFIFIAIFLPFLCVASKPDSTLNFGIAINYTKDLSNSYGGGNAYLTEFSFEKTWCGFAFGYSAYDHTWNLADNHFVPDYNLELKVPYKELISAQTLLVMAKLIPHNGRWVKVDLCAGLGGGVVNHMQLNKIAFRYDFQTQEFIYLDLTYKHLKQNFFGYTVGFNVEFKLIKRISIVGKFRLDDFDNWTAAFIGGGIKFRIY